MLIACEKAGRQARLIELDPKYCDVIAQRWQAFSGDTAVLEADGRTFEEIAARREAAAGLFGFSRATRRSDWLSDSRKPCQPR